MAQNPDEWAAFRPDVIGSVAAGHERAPPVTSRPAGNCRGRSDRVWTLAGRPELAPLSRGCASAMASCRSGPQVSACTAGIRQGRPAVRRRASPPASTGDGCPGSPAGHRRAGSQPRRRRRSGSRLRARPGAAGTAGWRSGRRPPPCRAEAADSHLRQPGGQTRAAPGGAHHQVRRKRQLATRVGPAHHPHPGYAATAGHGDQTGRVVPVQDADRRNPANTGTEPGPEQWPG